VAIAPTKPCLRTTWLVDKNAVEGRDYDVENLTHVMAQTNEQTPASSLVQAGVRSPARAWSLLPNENH